MTTKQQIQLLTGLTIILGTGILVSFGTMATMGIVLIKTIGTTNESTYDD